MSLLALKHGDHLVFVGRMFSIKSLKSRRMVTKFIVIVFDHMLQRFVDDRDAKCRVGKLL